MNIVAKRSKRFSQRRWLDSLGGKYARTSATVLAASTMAFSGQLFAADAANKDTTLEEVVITGIRKSLQAAQDIKRKAEEVVDSVTAQDIGALPDRSVSEALQRIPGITLERTNANRDPARLASEGGGVFIRGLSWVRSELNGRDIYSANSGRSLSFEDVSSDLLAGVDVYKNPSADHVEGGIGGIVNLRTRKPFDSSRQIFAASADINHADLRSKDFASANLLYSNQWQTGIGRVGALLSASLGNIGNRTDSLQLSRFDPHTVTTADAANDPAVSVGSTVYMPNYWGVRRIDWQQRRTAFDGVLQWAPSDSLTVTAHAFTGKADPHDLEHTFYSFNGGPSIGTIGANYQFDSKGVFVGGTETGSGLGTDVRYGENHYNTSDYSLNLEWTPNDSWKLSGDLQYVKSTADVLSMTAYTGQNSTGAETAEFGGLASDHPSLVFNPSVDPRAQSSYYWVAAMDHVEKNDADSKAARADAEYQFDSNPWLKSLRFGVRATDKDATSRGNGWNWHVLSANWAGGTDLLSSGSVPNSAEEFFTFPNFFRGTNTGYYAWFVNPSVVSNGTAHAYDILKGTEHNIPSWCGVGCKWTPTSTDFSTIDVGNADSVRGINDQKEKTQAAYLMVRFAHSSPLGPMDGNLGVRFVRTQNDTTATPGGSAHLANSNGGVPCTPSPTLDCTWYNAAIAFQQAFNGAQLKTSTSYTDALPSLNIRFMLKDDLQLRLAAARALTRPTFAQMSGINILTFDNGNSNFPYQPNPTANNNGLTGSAGNPNLKPTVSDQFDVSLEWYFAPTGSLTAAAFYKDITNYIFARQVLETISAGGQNLEFQITQNQNGAHGVIQGFELGYTQFYDQLPGALGGLGFQATYTYVDSRGGENPVVNATDPDQTSNAGKPLPLEGLSRTSYNLTAMYEKYGISARLAYNWRERYLMTTSAANIKSPVWSESYGQADGSVFYSVTSHIKVGLEASNLFNSKTILDVSDLGLNVAPRYSWSVTDRRVAAAIRVSY